MRIVVAGSSGLVGSALVPKLRTDGHEVLRLVRHVPQAADEIEWDPVRHELAERKLDGVDAIVNLAGENIGAGRWTQARRGRITQSRFNATQTLAHVQARMWRKPGVFISASAVGYYGSHGDEPLTEDSAPGTGFLADVCREWERLGSAPERFGVRTVQLRFGVILSPKGGALARLRPIFRWGLGGRLGAGTQWMSWVSLNDVVRVIEFALNTMACAGAWNTTAPNPVTNAEFTRQLAAALHRRAPLAVPTSLLRGVLGQMADETLLASTRALPQRLSLAGFAFEHPDLVSYFSRVEL